MKLFISDSDNPFFNLALEEWAVKNFDASSEDLMILYINKPSVVLGRNQNIFEEVNLKYCRENLIEVCRRVSGGGTVFHDYGNLNWTIVSKMDNSKVNSYYYFASHLIEFLKTKNLKAYLNKRNGIEVNGLKISGQAQFTNRKNILSHGTLLVNSELAWMQPAIEPPHNLKIESKASKSVRSKVANINQLLGTDYKTSEILNEFIHYVKVESYTLTESELSEIKEIETRYKSEEWIYDKSPSCEIDLTVKNINYHIKITKGIVVESTPYGLEGKKASELIGCC